MSSHEIAIVGCGLLGSMIAEPICAFAVSLDVGLKITLIDYDKIEKRNSPSNLGVPGTIGQQKVDHVAKIYESAGIEVKKQQARVTQKNLWLVKKADLIIGAVDNVETRKLLLSAANIYGIPYMDLGLSGIGGVVTWSVKDVVVTMPFASITEYEVPKDKQPACELVATRVFSAIAAECAVISMFIFISGHDPTGIVFQSIGREGANGDLVNWYITIGDGNITSKSIFVGSTKEKTVAVEEAKEANDDTAADQTASA